MQWTTHRARRSGVALAAVAGLLLASCGDDDDSENSTAETGETTTGDGGTEAYCDAALALETAPEPDIDFETASDEEIAEAAKAHAAGTMRPLAEDIVAAAPQELSEDLQVMLTALDQVEESGDFGVFDRPPAGPVGDRLHAYYLDHCGWETVAVSATNYHFDGLPSELPAGVTSFEMTNDGEDVHELLIFQRNEGVTDPIEDLLELPEDQVAQKVTMLGSPAFAPPGDGDYTVKDLGPGDYIAICFIPVGMTSDQGPPPADAGPPHFTQGMVSEFTVTSA